MEENIKTLRIYFFKRYTYFHGRYYLKLLPAVVRMLK